MKVSSFFIIFFMTSLIIGTSSFSPDATTFKVNEHEAKMHSSYVNKIVL